MRTFFYLLYRRDEGVSLLETAIFLIVLGITLGVGYPTFQKFLIWRQREVTRERQEHIVASVASYVLQHGYVPSSADPNAQEGFFGVSKPYTYGEDRKGLVPFKTLGLPEYYAKDGYGRYMTYVGRGIVKETGHLMALPTSLVDFCSTSLEEGFSIETMDGYRYGVRTKESFLDPVVLILISHGPNGYGAYQGELGQRAPDRQATPSGPVEHHNADATVHFKTAPYSTEEFTYCDDQILWITRDNLMALYAKKPCHSEIQKPLRESMPSTFFKSEIDSFNVDEE